MICLKLKDIQLTQKKEKQQISREAGTSESCSVFNKFFIAFIPKTFIYFQYYIHKGQFGLAQGYFGGGLKGLGI